MKKICYNYRYDGRAVSNESFEREFGKNWKRTFVRDQFGNWTRGYWSANPRDLEAGV